jgi:hypothetical protein
VDVALGIGIGALAILTYVLGVKLSTARFRAMGRALGDLHGNAWGFFLGEYPGLRVPFLGVEVREKGLLIGLGRKAFSFTWDQIVEASRETRPVIFPRWHPYGRTGGGEMLMKQMPHLRLEVDDGSERTHVLRFLFHPRGAADAADLIIHRWKYGHWPPGGTSG